MLIMLQMQQQQNVVYDSNGSCQCTIVPVPPDAAVNGIFINYYNRNLEHAYEVYRKQLTKDQSKETTMQIN
eukprot:15333104-Ditylum_brightwellii.AAC.1